jgi:hypothetical protein
MQMAATLQQLLSEAEAAYHALQLGKSAVEVRDSNGESVRFTAANASRLKAYIADLKAQVLAQETGIAKRVGPMRPIFG